MKPIETFKFSFGFTFWIVCKWNAKAKEKIEKI